MSLRAITIELVRIFRVRVIRSCARVESLTIQWLGVTWLASKEFAVRRRSRTAQSCPAVTMMNECFTKQLSLRQSESNVACVDTRIARVAAMAGGPSQFVETLAHHEQKIG